MTVAALFVETGGTYFQVPDVEPWDESRDARRYPGPFKAVAHPPCQRWGRFWHGSTRKPHQFTMGDDGGCFVSALWVVRKHGGVIEHPADSHAWKWYGLKAPPRHGGWMRADRFGGWTCYVEQGHYGHFARKGTWLYVCKVFRPALKFGPSAQRISPIALERHGYEKARRIGVVAMIGGKRKTEIRNETPAEFRDLLLAIARTEERERENARNAGIGWLAVRELRPLGSVAKPGERWLLPSGIRLAARAKAVVRL